MSTFAEDRLMGYDVIDSTDHKVGSVDTIYLNTDTDTPEFLGIKAGWLSTSHYVVPSAQVQIDEANRRVRLPYASDQIKNAPQLNDDSEVSQDEERRIFDYYGLTSDAAVTGRSGMATTVGAAGAAGLADTQRTVDTTRTARTVDTAGTAGPVDTARTVNTARTVDTVGTSRTADTLGERGEVRIPLSEERITVDKRPVESGSVRLRKVVRTEHTSVPVELRREEVVLERAPASGQTAAADAFREQTIDVTTTREEPVVRKEAVVTGEVVVRKTAETETRTVEGDVRKEDVVMDKDGRPVDTTDRTTDRATDRNRDRTIG
jgi:uncharacterized protein (TIGR02271 family)